MPYEETDYVPDIYFHQSNIMKYNGELRHEKNGKSQNSRAKPQ